jgi:hypothetical protein
MKFDSNLVKENLELVNCIKITGDVEREFVHYNVGSIKYNLVDDGRTLEFRIELGSYPTGEYSRPVKI